MSDCRKSATNISSMERDPVFLSQKGKPGGVATLDSNGKLPLSQIDITAVFTEHDPVYNADRGQPFGCATLDGSTLVPRAQLGSGTADSTVFLRGDGTWAPASGGGSGDVPSTRQINTTAPLTGGGNLSADRTLAVSTFIGSGVGHARGVVPDPGAIAGTTKFLREDATWAVATGSPGPAGVGINNMITQARGVNGMTDYLEVDPTPGNKQVTLKADADNPFEAVIDGTTVTFTSDQVIPLVYDDFNAVYLRNDGTFSVRQRPPAYLYTDPRVGGFPGDAIEVWFDLNANKIKSWTGGSWALGVEDTGGGDRLPSLFIGMAHYHDIVGIADVIGLSEPIGLDPYVRFQKFGSGKDGGYVANAGPIGTSFVDKEYCYFLLANGFQNFAFQHLAKCQGPMLMMISDTGGSVYALNNGCGGAWGGGSGGFLLTGDGVIGTDGGRGGAGGGGGASDATVSPPNVNGDGAHGGNHLSKQFFVNNTGGGAGANPIGSAGSDSEYVGKDEVKPSFLWGGSGGGGGGIGDGAAAGQSGGAAGSGWWSKSASLGFLILGSNYAIHCGGGDAGSIAYGPTGSQPNGNVGATTLGAGGGGGGGVIELMYSVLKVGNTGDINDVLNVSGGVTSTTTDGFPGTSGGAGVVLLWQI